MIGTLNTVRIIATGTYFPTRVSERRICVA